MPVRNSNQTPFVAIEKGGSGGGKEEQNACLPTPLVKGPKMETNIAELQKEAPVEEGKKPTNLG